MRAVRTGWCAYRRCPAIDALPSIDADLLGWWLAARQTPSGGLNGRPEKKPDVCYSWWALSALAIIGRLHWIDADALRSFITLSQVCVCVCVCASAFEWMTRYGRDQDGDDGGIADRPGDLADVFHTFFGLAGLSLLGDTRLKVRCCCCCRWLSEADILAALRVAIQTIDPTYALPVDVVARLGLA